MPAAWTVKDRQGHLLPHFIGDSRLEVGRKIVPTRYDAFRLQVSSSYREVFNHELETILEREDWQIVPVKRRRGARRPTDRQLEAEAPLTKKTTLKAIPAGMLAFARSAVPSIAPPADVVPIAKRTGHVRTCTDMDFYIGADVEHRR